MTSASLKHAGVYSKARDALYKSKSRLRDLYGTFWSKMGLILSYCLVQELFLAQTYLHSA